MLTCFDINVFYAFTRERTVKLDKRRMMTLIVCVIVVGRGIPYSANAQTRETPQQHISRLIKEAAGKEPVGKNGLRSETGFDRAFRSQYRDLIQANRDYAAVWKQIHSNQVDQLGSPQSLAHPATAIPALNQLHVGYAFEVEHERTVGRIHDQLRHIFETADVPLSTRSIFLKIFENGIVAPSSERRRCRTAEKAWIMSMDDLYQYANAHRESIQLVDGSITISDPFVRQEFNRKIVSEEVQRQAFIKKTQEYTQMQERVFRMLAIDPANVGLK